MRGYHVVNVEYIRKDLLLEWLEAKVYEHNEDKFDDGFNTALGQVIDKINTLNQHIMSTRWEYKVVKRADMPYSDLQKSLDSYGRHYWKLTGIDGDKYIFRRPKGTVGDYEE